jgi:hypothetical protein
MMNPWSFSMKKIQLARLITTPTSFWKYEYLLPGDRLGNPHSVRDSAAIGGFISVDWEIQGDKLLTNLESVYIDYQYQTPEFAMPQYFVQLLKYMVAWHVAEPITEQGDKALRWRQIAVGDPAENGRGGFFRQASVIDSKNQPVRVIEDYTLVSVRN